MLTRDFTQLSREFDLAVIGGGITGIAVAREAAHRGLSVVCVEKNDWGWATSAATSKLLHGGLRYLKNYEFGIVRESLRERRISGCAAPNLVRPLRFLVPIYAKRKPKNWEMHAALTIYDWLGYDRNRGVAEDKRLPPYKKISREELLAEEPDIESKDLIGGFVYYDYQSIHPERLSIAWALTGARDGALMLNHCELTDFDIADAPKGGRRIRAAQVRDTIDGTNHELRAKLFVNASGPWMDRLLALAEPQGEKHVVRSTGIHLITEPLFADKHPRDHAVFINGSRNDFLILPWRGRSLIGPTDLSYQGSPDDALPREEEIDGLRSDLRENLPAHTFERLRLRHAITGVRPLAADGADPEKGTRGLSRRSEVYDHAPKLAGLLSVAGGKWTTSRALGAQVVDHALRKTELRGSPARRNRSRSHREAFVDAPGFAESAEEYRAFALREYAAPGISQAVHDHLITCYGVRHREVLALVQQDATLAERILPEGSDSPADPCLDILAQVDYAVQHEGALTLEDLVRRRLVIGTYGDPGETALAKIAGRAAVLLDWNEQRTRMEIEDVRDFYRKSLAGVKNS